MATTILPGRSSLPSRTSPLGSAQSMPTPSFGPGMSGQGWFVVPANTDFNQILGWKTQTDSTGAVFAIDPFGRRYRCYLNAALQLVFQTLFPVF